MAQVRVSHTQTTLFSSSCGKGGVEPVMQLMKAMLRNPQLQNGSTGTLIAVRVVHCTL
jgi:hypothetical protein